MHNKSNSTINFIDFKLVPRSSLSDSDAKLIRIKSNNNQEPVLRCSAASKHPSKWSEQPYVCESFNYLSTAKESFYFLVNGISLNSSERYLIRTRKHVSTTNLFSDPPKIVTKFEDNISLSEGSDNSILCSAVGSPHINVYWKDGKIVIPSNELRYSTELHHDKHFTVMEYTCVAENEFGSDFQTISIQIRG